MIVEEQRIDIMDDFLSNDWCRCNGRTDRALDRRGAVRSPLFPPEGEARGPGRLNSLHRTAIGSFAKGADGIPAFFTIQAEPSVSHGGKISSGDVLSRQNARQQEIQHGGLMKEDTGRDAEDGYLADASV